MVKSKITKFTKFINVNIRGKIIIGFTIVSIIFIIPLVFSTISSQNLASTNELLVTKYAVMEQSSLEAEILFQDQLSLIKTYITSNTGQSTKFNTSSVAVLNKLQFLSNLTQGGYGFSIINNVTLLQNIWQDQMLTGYFKLPSQSILLQLKNLTDLLQLSTGSIKL